MTAGLAMLAFGELEPASVWGAAWQLGPGSEAGLVLGAGEQRTLVADGLSLLPAGPDGGEWRLDAGGASLVVTPTGDAVAVRAPEDGIEGWDQLCRVSGRLAGDGTVQTLDCLGLRTWWSRAIDLERYESIRAVSTWFDPDEGMAITGFRPRKAKGHDRDVLTGAVIAAEGSAAVEDPRLSTTYEGGGWPVRAGLELWLAGEGPERRYPRRAAGEAIGARALAVAGALELRLEPFRWHSRGRDGAGMYLLAHRR